MLDQKYKSQHAKIIVRSLAKPIDTIFSTKFHSMNLCDHFHVILLYKTSWNSGKEITW